MYAISVKNLATPLEIAVRERKRNRDKEITLPSKTQNIRNPKHLRHNLIANEQIILQKKAEAAPMSLTDLNGSNKTNQQKPQKKSKNKDIRPTQDFYQVLQIL